MLSTPADGTLVQHAWAMLATALQLIVAALQELTAEAKMQY
jgi:hypothetical protein